MAFWGVEVKPGKPFVHPSSNGARPRLHISQATLGIGSATNKSVVQCNVGNKSPVFLCSLFPDLAESSQLNLEFEEAEEVIFSVVGPRSVHLSGFYLGSGRHYAGDDESESHGEDIAGTDTERSNDEDEYEDSFIDDDDDPEVFSPSPSLNDAVHDDSDNGKPRERKGRQRRLRKKYHTVESDKEGSFQQHNIVDGKTKAQASESEDEERFFISSFLKTKSAVKDSKIVGPEMYPEKHQSGVPEVGTNLKRKRKEEFIESPVKVDKANTHDKLKENLARQGQVIAAADKEAAQVNGFFPTSDEAASANCLKKKKKKRVKEEKAQQEEDIIENNVNPVVTENLAPEAQQVTDGEDSEKKDIKKKKKKHRDQHSEADVMNEENVLLTDRKVKSDAKMKDRDADDDCRVRKLPNGLTIEQLEIGNPDGKVVAPGKKISVRYVGKFMENGLVFDSNTGEKPLKFRLGSGEVMKGWDEGLDGMRIGGKRRLTIPPSLSHANKGSNHKVPSDSWLVYDIEVVRVR